MMSISQMLKVSTCLSITRVFIYQKKKFIFACKFYTACAAYLKHYLHLNNPKPQQVTLSPAQMCSTF